MCGRIILCVTNLPHLAETRRILEEFYEVHYIPATQEALEENILSVDAYFAHTSVVLTADIMKKAQKLRVIATPSTGLDHIDIKTAQRLGIPVLGLRNDREFLDRVPSTAELAWALILACSRRLCPAVQAAREGRWAREGFIGHQIGYKTLGILGCGRLGTMVARFGEAFSMNVIGCDKLKIAIPYVRQVSFEELFAQSDILSIHIHLTDANRGIVNAKALNKMKKGSILVNTSRGAIVDEEAVIEALERGRLAAYGTDVIDGEWLEDKMQHPLIHYMQIHDNVVITPHIGGVTYEAQAAAFQHTARKLVSFLNDEFHKERIGAK